MVNCGNSVISINVTKSSPSDNEGTGNVDTNKQSQTTPNEAELLGDSLPLDILIDGMEGSLLGTPSKNVPRSPTPSFMAVDDTSLSGTSNMGTSKPAPHMFWVIPLLTLTLLH